MSVSLHIYGIRPPDDDWRKMKAAWEACEAAGIDVPSEVLLFFDEERPDDAGVLVGLSHTTDNPIAREYRGEYDSGYEIDIADLPPGIKTIRAVLS